MVVTHGGTIRCLRFAPERWNYSQAERWAPGQSPANCAVTVYRAVDAGDRLELEEYNRVYWTVGSLDH